MATAKLPIWTALYTPNSHLPTYLPTHPPTYLPTYLPISTYPVCLPACLPYLPTCLPAYLLLPACLPACLPTYLPTCLHTHLLIYSIIVVYFFCLCSEIVLNLLRRIHADSKLKFCSYLSKYNSRNGGFPFFRANLPVQRHPWLPAGKVSVHEVWSAVLGEVSLSKVSEPFQLFAWIEAVV